MSPLPLYRWILFHNDISPAIVPPLAWMFVPCSDDGHVPPVAAFLLGLCSELCHYWSDSSRCDYNNAATYEPLICTFSHVAPGSVDDITHWHYIAYVGWVYYVCTGTIKDTHKQSLCVYVCGLDCGSVVVCVPRTSPMLDVYVSDWCNTDPATWFTQANLRVMFLYSR